MGHKGEMVGCSRALFRTGMPGWRRAAPKDYCSLAADSSSNAGGSHVTVSWS